MPEYRRPKAAGGTYFFTIVTFNRNPFLTTPLARNLLRAAWLDVMARYPFQMDAICLLPDHLHCLLTLPEEDTKIPKTGTGYSIRLSEVKRIFTKEYARETGYGGPRNNSRQKRGEAAIWQRRFWEHMIRDEEDFQRHVEYIHYNPVKHGLVNAVRDWEWSSFHRYVQMGYFPRDWGEKAPDSGKTLFGEV